MRPVKVQRKQILTKADYKSATQTFIMNKDGSLSTIKDHKEAIKSK